MNDKYKGIYRKFNVERVDHSPKHPDCQYFVLDVTHDKYAIPALVEYAKNCRFEYPLLADDIEKMIRGPLDILSEED